MSAFMDGCAIPLEYLGLLLVDVVLQPLSRAVLANAKQRFTLCVSEHSR